MRTFDFARMCDDLGVLVNVGEGSRWANLDCCFCEDQGAHLGFHLTTGHFNCYKCGFHSQEETVSKLFHVSRAEAKGLIREYREMDRSLPDRVDKPHAKTCEWPMGCGTLQPAHFTYLKRRGFDNPRTLARTYGLRGTIHLGDYAFRIIAPIINRGRMVSYQARDITGRSKIPYKACAEEKEVIHHKHLLYAEDLVPGDTVVVVEGIVDAWKLGPGAVATFGVGFSMEQVRRIARFKKRLILYDRDPKCHGQKAAVNLANTLMGFAGSTYIIELANLKKGQKDPGDLEEKEARKIMRSLL